MGGNVFSVLQSHDTHHAVVVWVVRFVKGTEFGDLNVVALLRGRRLLLFPL